MRRLAFAAFFTVAVFLAILTSASASSSTDQLIAKWNELNSKCRGGSGDNPKTLEACDARDELSSILEAMGYSYGCDGEAGYQSFWRNDCGNYQSAEQANSSSTDPIKLLYEYQNDGTTVIGLQATADSVKINKVTVNRGNCKSVMDAAMGIYGMPEGSFEGLANSFFGLGPVFQKKLPASVRFGELWVEQYACLAIEVRVTTNKGEWTWTLE
jgi:hypothetical protein